jgi:hypothetical protein
MNFCQLKYVPPEARGTLFEKTVPLDPLQKLFIRKKTKNIVKYTHEKQKSSGTIFWWH